MKRSSGADLLRHGAAWLWWAARVAISLRRQILVGAVTYLGLDVVSSFPAPAGAGGRARLVTTIPSFVLVGLVLVLRFWRAKPKGWGRSVIRAAAVFVFMRLVPILALVAPLLVFGLVLAFPPSRQRLLRFLRARWIGWVWARSCGAVGLATKDGRIPKPKSIEGILGGHVLVVELADGTAEDIADRAEALAAFLGVREVRVARSSDNAGLAIVTIVMTDHLASCGVVAWPMREEPELSLWNPIPIGVGEDGVWVVIELPEHNLLLGGEPGAGKSAAISMLVATAALDPDVQLTLLDGKLVELAVWRGCADRFAGVEVAEAIEVLEEVQAEMNLRYEILLSEGKRKVEIGDDIPLHVVVCDELAHYLTAGDRKQSAAFANLLRDLVSRGRAAGIIVLAATQKPSSDVIPTSLRDLFGFRWALRCSTPQASDTILGAGWAARGYSASRIDAAERGLGYLLHEGGTPEKLKACYLPDSDLVRLAKRGEALRKELEASPPDTPASEKDDPARPGAGGYL